MNLYNKDGIIVSTIEKGDEEKILEYFSENTFNCDYETGALKPSNEEFLQIMNKIISREDDENNILVLKKDGEVIGYEAMFVEFARLNIGHIAINKLERGKGYGELLTKLAILVAENEDRDVCLYCNYPCRYLGKLGFTTKDNIHYLYKRKGIKSQFLPKLFVSLEAYKKRQEEKTRKEIEEFSGFLNSATMEYLNNL